MEIKRLLLAVKRLSFAWMVCQSYCGYIPVKGDFETTNGAKTKIYKVNMSKCDHNRIPQVITVLKMNSNATIHIIFNATDSWYSELMRCAKPYRY